MSRATVETRDGRIFELPTEEEDAAITKAALEDPDAQPMTDEALSRMRPAKEVLPPEFFKAVARARGGRPKSASPKVFTGIRFDPDVLAGLRATGKGWQTRANAALRAWLSGIR